MAAAAAAAAWVNLMTSFGYNQVTREFLAAQGGIDSATTLYEGVGLDGVKEMIDQLTRLARDAPAPKPVFSPVGTRKMKAFRLYLHWQIEMGVDIHDRHDCEDFRDNSTLWAEYRETLDGYKRETQPTVEDLAASTTPLKSFKDFIKWNEKLRGALQNRRNAVLGTPYNYLIDRPADSVTCTDEERNADYDTMDDRLCKTVRLVGACYNTDNQALFDVLRICTRDHGPWSFIRHLKNTRDGRAAYFILKAQGEGPAGRKTRKDEAWNLLNHTKYHGNKKGFSFSSYIEHHTRAHNILLEEEEPVTETRKVTQFLDGILAPSLMAAKDIVATRPDLQSDFTACTLLLLSIWQTQQTRPTEDKRQNRQIGQVGRNSQQPKRNQGGRGKGKGKPASGAHDDLAKYKQPSKTIKHNGKWLYWGNRPNPEWQALPDALKKVIIDQREKDKQRKASSASAVSSTSTVTSVSGVISELKDAVDKGEAKTVTIGDVTYTLSIGSVQADSTAVRPMESEDVELDSKPAARTDPEPDGPDMDQAIDAAKAASASIQFRCPPELARGSHKRNAMAVEIADKPAPYMSKRRRMKLANKQRREQAMEDSKSLCMPVPNPGAPVFGPEPNPNKEMPVAAEREAGGVTISSVMAAPIPKKAAKRAELVQVKQEPQPAPCCTSRVPGVVDLARGDPEELYQSDEEDHELKPAAAWNPAEVDATDFATVDKSYSPTKRRNMVDELQRYAGLIEAKYRQLMSVRDIMVGFDSKPDSVEKWAAFALRRQELLLDKATIDDSNGLDTWASLAISGDDPNKAADWKKIEEVFKSVNRGCSNDNLADYARFSIIQCADNGMPNDKIGPKVREILDNVAAAKQKHKDEVLEQMLAEADAEAEAANAFIDLANGESADEPVEVPDEEPSGPAIIADETECESDPGSDEPEPDVSWAFGLTDNEVVHSE